jgi:predicted HTH transcriptional regulator
VTIPVPVPWLCGQPPTYAIRRVEIARPEVASLGLLPPGVTVADLKRDHASRPRNPLIAGVFYLDRLEPRPAKRTSQDDLGMLQSLGLVELSGRGAGVRWRLRRNQQ